MDKPQSRVLGVHYRKNRWVGPSLKHGISFGSALAMVISYTQNESIFWAIIHGIFGWFYVIYRLIF